MKRIFLLVSVLILSSCSQGPAGKKDEFRIGIPSGHMSLFRGRELSPLADFNMIVLKPEERARNLEVLIFSTRSSAFDCVIVPAPTAPILEKWADPFPMEWAQEVRPEVLGQFVREGKLFALPLTLDFPVFVYREDVFRDNGLPLPESLGAMRDSLRKLSRKRNAGLLSTVPEETLFISLLASEEGSAPVRFYSRSAINLMDLFYEFDLRPVTALDARLGIGRGEAVGAFVQLSEVGRIMKESRDKGVFLKVSPLPATGKNMAVYNGLCLMGYGLGGKNLKALRSFVEEPFQSGLVAAGYAPVLKKDYQIGALKAAVDPTVIIPCPFGWEECEILRDAIKDVLVNGLAPEGSLRRAEARRKNMKE